MATSHTPTRSDLDTWTQEVGQHFPHLSKPQAYGLALWSFGMVLAQASGLTTVSLWLACLLEQRPAALRQRLREWYEEAAAKKSRGATHGVHRQALPVAPCFAPLLRWVLDTWPATEKRLALALDATTLGQTFTVLVLCVVYRGCALPIAWKVLAACAKGAWHPHWLALLTDLERQVPADWCVLVLADRGLYAQWLYHAIVKLGWHPFLRINAGGKYHRLGQGDFLPMSDLAKRTGQLWCEAVTCFKRYPVTCTLLAYHEAQHADAWLILTHLDPAQTNIAWYRLRMWCEDGFKDFKRGGWQWQHTRMTQPERAERLWLALAVATLWVVRVGGEADATLPVSSLDALPPTQRAHGRHTPQTRLRLVSCFKRGLIVIVTALLAGHPLPLGTFHPEPWPDKLNDQKTYT
jgi:Transposase DDE domain